MKINYSMATFVFLISQVCSTTVHAQTEFRGSAIIPSNPNSAENISYVRAITTPNCGRQPPYHSVSVANNNITIAFSAWTFPDQFTLPSPNRYIDLVDLGRLLPGDYTLTTTTEGPPCPFASTSNPTPTELNKFPFKVTDGRTKATRANPTLDYSGQWWDEADSGWGLFIWQDGASNTMAAWMTYTVDGKPAWYVFQPVWEQHNYTRPVDVWQTSKPPGATSPPAGPTKLITVGKAALAFIFSSDTRESNAATVELLASFAYKLGDGPEQTRTLKRFKAK